MSGIIEPHACRTDESVAHVCDAGVIIPVYNRATVIMGTLESVARQTVKPRKLVVVDDGSTDDTVEAVRTWIDAARPPFEAQLICCEHVSAAAARNVGLAAIGDLGWTAFLDSDDCWPQDFLARAASVLEDDAAAVAVSVDRRFLDGQGREFQYDDCRELAADPVAWFFRNGAGVASATLLRTSAVRAAGGWNTSLKSAEDSMLFTLVALEGPWRHAPGEPVEFHHGNASQRDEEGNLSGRHADAYRRWAAAYEQIYEAIDGRYPAQRHEQLRHGVAGYWYRAGKQLEGLGKTEEAQRCFARALAWRPTMLRAWGRRKFGEEG